jgi:hypothetical protein
MESLRFTAEQCEKLKYPIGCPVWYNDLSSRKEGGPTKRGVVQSALWRDNKLFFEVTYSDKTNCVITTEEVDSDQIGFGSNCPVTILPNDAVEGESLLEGEIVLCLPSPTDPNRFVYTAMIFLDGSATKVRYECGIDEKRVTYRKVVERVGEEKNSSSDAVGITGADAGYETGLVPCEPPSITPNVSASSNAKKMKRESPLMMRRTNSGSGHEEVFPPGNMHFVPPSITYSDPSNSQPQHDTARNSRWGPTSNSTSSQQQLGAHSNSRWEPPPNSTSIPQLLDASSNNQWDTSRKNVGVEDTTSSSWLTKLEISVPLWLQKDRSSQRSLFFHLIGVRGCNMDRIRREAKYNVHIVQSEDDSVPMKIYVNAMDSSPLRQDFQRARKMIQDLFFEYVGHDECRGRLLYEIAVQWPGPHRPKASTSRAVIELNPFSFGTDLSYLDKQMYMSIVELPFVSEDDGGKSFHAAHNVIFKYTRDKIQATGCVALTVQKGFRFSTDRCDPYVFVYGKNYKSVDQAVEVVKKVIFSHQKNCSCTYNSSC